MARPDAIAAPESGRFHHARDYVCRREKVTIPGAVSTNARRCAVCEKARGLAGPLMS